MKCFFTFQKSKLLFFNLFILLFNYNKRRKLFYDNQRSLFSIIRTFLQYKKVRNDYDVILKRMHTFKT